MSALLDAARQQPHNMPPSPPAMGRYRVEFVTTEAELDEVMKLRFRVFNLELNEGLEASHLTGRDEDAFDPLCHHLVVRDLVSERIVGTYRLQTRAMAEAGIGFYSATEYHLTDLPESVLAHSVEIGRASIEREHRSLRVLYLLWQGLGAFMGHNDLRFLFGCCSLTSQDPDEATRVYRRLEARGQLHPEYHVRALSELACLVDHPSPGSDRIPRLMRAYLSLGAMICSEPAIDRAFGTIDYLALFDLETMDRSRLAFFRCA